MYIGPLMYATYAVLKYVHTMHEPKKTLVAEDVARQCILTGIISTTHDFHK